MRWFKSNNLIDLVSRLARNDDDLNDWRDCRFDFESRNVLIVKKDDTSNKDHDVLNLSDRFSKKILATLKLFNWHVRRFIFLSTLSSSMCYANTLTFPCTSSNI